MKKFIFCLFALIGMTGAISAQTVTAPDVYANKGETVIATLNYTCKADTYTGMKISLTFPTGFSVVEKTDDNSAFSGWDNLEYSIKEGTVTYAAAGTSTFAKAAIDVEFTVGSSVALGDYEIGISGILEGPQDAEANISGVINVHVTDYLTLDENSKKEPATTTTPGFVKVIRTIQAGQWSTLCLPFNLTKTQFNEIFGDDVILAEFSDYKYDAEKDAINIEFVETEEIDGEYFYSNWPYIVKTTKDISEFNVDNVTLEVYDIKAQSSSTHKEGKVSVPNGYFIGSYAATVVPEKSAFISNNKFYYSVGKTNMKGLRGYFTFYQTLAAYDAESRISFYLNDGNGQTKINVVDFLPNDGEYYNLNGLRVETPSKGIYIKDGKKVVVK